MFAAVLSVVLLVGHGLAFVLNAAVEHFVFKPTASEALALDLLGRSEALRDMRQRPFKAFIERARKHGLFSDGFQFAAG